MKNIFGGNNDDKISKQLFIINKIKNEIVILDKK